MRVSALLPLTSYLDLYILLFHSNDHLLYPSLHPGGGGWYKFEDPVRLSQDLLRLKDRYMRDDGRDTASGSSFAQGYLFSKICGIIAK